MKTRFLVVTSIALFAAATATFADGDRLGVVGNGSSLQGVSTNGSNRQGLSPNGINMQGTSPNSSNQQSLSPNGINMQGISPNGARSQGADPKVVAGPRPEGPSTGHKLRGVHVVGGKLFAGDAPSRAPKGN